MLQHDRTIAHLPFFEEMASRPEDDVAWKEASAGLVVLRLVDVWIKDGPRAIADDALGMRSARQAVEELGWRTKLRPILTSVLDAIVESRVVDMEVLAPRLMTYGQWLEYEARWALAGDVYHTIVAHAHPVEEAQAATQAHLRLGYCLRQMGDLGASVRAYETAGGIARAANDIVGILRARIGEAKAAMSRGNMPRAQEILDATIVHAARQHLNDVRSMALHDRSMIAHQIGDYELGVKLAYEALELTQSPRERDRILADIATNFYALGVKSAARDAYLIIVATAEDQYERWTATLNLMELASDDGDLMLFEQYRRSVNPNTLPPLLRATYWMLAGTGYANFGQVEDARLSLVRALAIAEENELNQYVINAEAALKSLERRVSRPLVTPTALPSEEVEAVARGLRARREAIGV